ncbi:carbamoyltransferase [Candidatus Omnitrophota bacterium]
MNILGLNAYHGDSSAALLKDGKLIAAVEEERFKRIKHWAGFPIEAIKYCLKEGELNVKDIDYIVTNKSCKANLHKKLIFLMRKRPDIDFIRNRVSRMKKFSDIKETLAEELSVPKEEIHAKVIGVEHHRAHLASSFFLSDMDEAALVSIDGFEDFTSCMAARGKDNKIYPLYEINFPHSLGIFYTVFTQLLGFNEYGDEYKVMGLAAFGEPKYVDRMEKVIKLKPHGRFELNLQYFLHHRKNDEMEWNNSAPIFNRLYSDELCELFGNPRKEEEEMNKHHMDIAASVQAMYEKVFFHIINHVQKMTGSNNLCLAGGCALNSLANGKIFERTAFKEVFIQPAAHDSGGAVGAAYYLYNQILGKPRVGQVECAYLGPEYSDDEVFDILEKEKSALEGMSITRAENIDELVQKTAEHISNGKIIGWFQNRMEWGPRALGNRSILADPRRKDIKDILNLKIKFREKFRPFAPSILEEYVGEYFEIDYPDPFMLKVYPIREGKRGDIPAVTHVDGTGRLQTVSRETNPLYWKLIDRFRELTGVPILLNTSFNENEPIICRPEEAIDCFLRTKMDILVLGSYIIERE